MDQKTEHRWLWMGILAVLLVRLAFMVWLPFYDTTEARHGLVLWLLKTRQFSSFKALPWFSGTLLFFLVWLPLYSYVEIRTPGFMRYFLVHENFLRYIEKDYGDLYGGPHLEVYGTIWLMVLITFLPWTFFLIGALFLFSSFLFTFSVGRTGVYCGKI